MSDRTELFHIAVTLDSTGRQAHGIVSRDPVKAAQDSHAFPLGDVLVYGKDGVQVLANDDGVLPYRERTQGEDEDLGLTWQLAK